jgi:phosphatidylglycerophosphatase A
MVARFFGAGQMKPGPGTWGSVAAVLIWYVGLRAAHLSGTAVVIASLAAAAVATLVGIPAASIVERESGREDPGFVVIDEVAGQWLTLAAAVVDPWHALLALGLFRFFDIVKPWPVRQMERLNGGLGIVVDDLAAGGYGLIVMLIVRHWW